MKHIRLMMMAAAAVMMTFAAQAEKTAKAVLADSGATLKFVYDETNYGTKGTDWFSVAEAEALDPSFSPEWGSCWKTVTKVIFDPSFADYRPVRCNRWFDGFSRLETIEGSGNLDISKADNLSSMFSDCRSVETLDLTSFDTKRVTSCNGMFNGCSNLKTIYATYLFDISGKVNSSTVMFSGCTALKGGAGTTYSDSKKNATCARIDGGVSEPGYFTRGKLARVEVCDEGATLRFCYDNRDLSGLTRGTDWFEVPESVSGYASPWKSVSESVTKVVFADSFKDYRPKRCGAWFEEFKNLSSIENIGNLVTANVTDMSYMFFGCSSLTVLDVSGFDTANVTDMSFMFCGCSSLTTLDVSGFNTAMVTDMSGMFFGCSSLTTLDVTVFDTANVTDMTAMFEYCSKLMTLDVSGFDTAKVTGMAYMFDGCSSLTVLDVSGFDTAKVTRMDGMFEDCSSLTTLDVSGFDTANVTDMAYMFYGCSSLTTLDLASFDTSKVTGMAFMFYGCSKLMTLDVSGFDTSNVTRMYSMFCNCSSLKSLDVTGFDTANVTDMAYMFCGCSSLSTLDLASFDTSKVTGMACMFYCCSSLKRIAVRDKFVTTSVTASDGMFYACTALVGGAGTAYDSAKTDREYACIDGKDGQPGYFTRGYAAKGVAGEYGMWTLPDLGIEPPAAGTVYAVTAYGLPSGLKLKYNAAKKDKKGKVIVKAKTDWWVEGVPTAALNAGTNPMYLAVTVGKKTTWYPIAFSVRAQEVTDLGTFTIGTAFNETGWLPGLAGGGWSVSGLPKGLKYTANIVYKDPKKKSKGIKYAADTTYGKFSAAGLYTVTAKKKKGGFYETLKFRVLVNPAGEFTTRNFTAYETFATMKDTSWKKVSGLPAGLKFTAKKYTVSGTITKPGTFAVTFTPKKGKAWTEMWNVAVNPAGPALGFNTTGEKTMSVLQGQKGKLNEITFPADGTVSVSGLPKGMKLVKNTDGTYSLSGMPSATGTYFVTVKAAKNGQTVTQRVAVTVKANPMAGTYYGYSVTMDGNYRYRTASLTIAASGKATLKYTEGANTYTLTASAGEISGAEAGYRFVQKANTKKKIPARTVMVGISFTDTIAIGDWAACAGTVWDYPSRINEGGVFKVASVSFVNALRADPETGFASKATYVLTSKADPAEVIYATYAYSSSTGKFTVKGKLPRGKAFSATVSAVTSGNLMLAPISAVDADGTRYLLLLTPGRGGEVRVDGFDKHAYAVDSQRFDFGTGYTALPTTFAAAIANSFFDYLPVGVNYSSGEKEWICVRANGTKYFQVSFDEGKTWSAKTAYAYDKARGLITLSFTNGKTKYALDLLYAQPEFLCGQMKRQSNPVTNKKTKKTTYTTEYGAAVACFVL